MAESTRLLGLQTISWGSNPESLDEIADCAVNLGFKGLELAQVVDVFGTPEEVLQGVTRRGLRVAGLAGGSLASRISQAAMINPGYLYVDEWDGPSIEKAFDEGIDVAFHPHYCKRLDTFRSLSPYLGSHPKLGVIIDSAHQYLCGEDSTECLRRNFDRVMAIHLKDWNPKFGKTPQNFARGFTYLGGGILENQIRMLLDTAIELGFSGWFVVEQDAAQGEPCGCAERSRDWLRKLGI